jgi:hypothetical protein
MIVVKGLADHGVERGKSTGRNGGGKYAISVQGILRRSEPPVVSILSFFSKMKVPP